MRAKTAEMIHQFRKQRNITQQHLADVIGVSVGTVSKWENGITEPDLSLLMDIAAYFKNISGCADWISKPVSDPG